MKKSLMSILAASCLALTAAAQQIPQFKAGDVVALVGDSITHGGHYHSYVWLYYMTRFPDMPLTLINCGVGGDTAGSMEYRLVHDALSWNPTYVTLTFGMNDTGYWDTYNKEDSEELSDRKVAASLEHFRGMENILKSEAPDAEIVMIGGSPYDETSRFNDNVLAGKNDAICRIIDALSAGELAAGINLAEYVNTPQYRQASSIMYMNEERFEVEKRLREYVWMHTNMFRDTDRIWVDDAANLDAIAQRAHTDGFVGMSHYWYRKSHFPEIRQVWKDYMDKLVETIYEVNKPVDRKVVLERL